MNKYDLITDEQSDEFNDHYNQMMEELIDKLIEITDKDRTLNHISHATLVNEFVRNLSFYLFKHYIEQFDKEVHINECIKNSINFQKEVAKEAIQKLRKIN